MPTLDSVPHKIGPYRLLEKIGEGGMGVVYLARDNQNRTAAVKVLGPLVADDLYARRRLAREVETMRRVRSPHVAEVLDADITGPLPYVATRYVNGRTLEEVVRDDGPLRGAGLDRLAAGLASALTSLHKAGVVHRDLKPGNVMLDEGKPVVIDFGIANAADTVSRITQAGMVMGTPGYLAPEVIEGQPSSSASDVHSWGATVAYAATGREPYGTGGFQNVFYRVLMGQADLDGVPERLLPSIRAALSPDPNSRPAAQSLARACGELYSRSGGVGDESTIPDDRFDAARSEGLRANPTRVDQTKMDRTRVGDAAAQDAPPPLAPYVDPHPGWQYGRDNDPTLPGPSTMAADVADMLPEPESELGVRGPSRRTALGRRKRKRPDILGIAGLGQVRRLGANLRTAFARGGPGVSQVPANSRNRTSGDAAVSHPGGTVEEPERYLIGSLPERSPAGRTISLIAQITTIPGTGKAIRLKPVEVSPEGRDVTLTVTAPGLIALGDLEHQVHVPFTGNSEPVRFGFRAGRSGLHRVVLRAFADGTFLAELRLEVSVELGASVEEGPVHFAVVDSLAAEPGEVTLQVSRTDEGRYSFQLLGDAFYPLELTRRLARDPAEVVQGLVQELRSMAGRESPYSSPALARNRVRNLGAQLWADVVPEAIRRQFWEQADRIKLFAVASDMDIVPWELLYPVDPGNDRGFLVEQFPVMRRVYGHSRARHLSLSSAGYIVPPGSPANALEEVQAVRARLGDHIQHLDVCSQLDGLNRLLDVAPSVLHFACHNTFTEQNGSVIHMDGGPLRPNDLTLARQTRSMAAASPLVFLNACRTAGEIPGLTETMGWAKQFMTAGAGAFVGTLWPVRSDSAKTFADTFYQALAVDGASLGAASLQARRAIADDEGDPTWLAYTIYGNPSATIG